MKLLSHFSFLFLLFTPVFCDSQSNVDSLRDVWNSSAEADTSRLKALNHLIRYGYIYTNPDSARILCQLGIDLADEKGLTKQKTPLVNMIGITYSMQGDFENAVKAYQLNLELYAELNNLSGVGKTYNNLGLVHLYQGDYADAITCYDKCLDITIYLKDTGGISSATQNLAMAYTNLGEHDKALSLYRRSLEIEGDNARLDTRATVSSAIGGVFLIKEEFDSALYYYQRALSLYEQAGQQTAYAIALQNIGTTYRVSGQYKEALDYLFLAKDLDEQLGLGRELTLTLSDLGSAYYNMGNTGLGIKYSEQAINLAQEIGIKEAIKASAETLKILYAKVGRYKEAYEMSELYYSTRDTLAKAENQKALIKQQLKSDFEKQEAIASAEHSMELEKRDTQAKADQAKKTLIILFVSIGLGLVIIFCLFLINRFRLIRKQKNIIELQKEIVEHKNKEILDSINYAKRIQKAILPPAKMVTECLPDSFILYKPKDIVAGDFYWIEQKNGYVLFAAADCTGHGVPGAMVSVICNNGLNRSVREHGLYNPAKILDRTREIVISEFEKSEEEVKDGMDISLVALNATELLWAGANNPLWIIRNSETAPELFELKPDKQPIGKHQESKPFTEHRVEIRKGDLIYVFTDGYQDQFGGEKGKKFKAATFKNLLLEVCKKSISEQQQIIDETFEKWRGDFEQLDDICVIGVKI